MKFWPRLLEILPALWFVGLEGLLLRILRLQKLNFASWIPLFYTIIRILFMVLIWLPPVLPSSILTNIVVILNLGLLAGVEFFFNGGE
ncbi:hypothetical protein L3X38_040829 [Prunus dulcis]|uniref:Uncharacterized protein n=1 Tax=Prunus dulcis TaxID=3755 RepID=A0AAD4UTL1_PRUDU|nr:hypothetical protein L3X38_040829 [Prunus dulcis]